MAQQSYSFLSYIGLIKLHRCVCVCVRAHEQNTFLEVEGTSLHTLNKINIMLVIALLPVGKTAKLI